jgi:ubiquinone/menaquinone biosynthesis C-methylase UbiE
MIAVASRPDSLLTRMEGLSDPTRLRLLHLLEKHELGVAELVDVLRLPQSTVSRHLKTLAHQGWVKSRGRGPANLYRMAALEAPAKRLWALARDESSAWATLRQDDLRLSRRLRDRARDAEAFFAGAAGEWERMRSVLYGSLFTREALLALLPPQWVVVDLGCGTGPLTVALAPHVARVIGVDQSAAMLRAARRATASFDNVELHEGRLESLPLADATCDAALLVLGLSYVPDPAAVLSEAARVLRPGGRAVVVDLLPHDHEHFRERMGQQWLGFDRERVSGLAASAGLSLRSFRELAPEPGTTGPALFVSVAERPRDPQGKPA